MRRPVGMPLDEEHSQGDYSIQEHKDDLSKKAEEFHLIAIPKRVSSELQLTTSDPVNGPRDGSTGEQTGTRPTCPEDLVFLTAECGNEYCRVHLCTGELEELGGPLFKTQVLYTKFHTPPSSKPVEEETLPDTKDKEGKTLMLPAADSDEKPGEQSDSSSSSYPPLSRIPSPKLFVPDKLSSKIKKYMEMRKEESEKSQSPSASETGDQEDHQEEKEEKVRPVSAPVIDTRIRRKGNPCATFSNVKARVNTRWERGGPKMKFSLREAPSMFSCYKKKKTLVPRSDSMPFDPTTDDLKSTQTKKTSTDGEPSENPTSNPTPKPFRVAVTRKFDKAIQTEEFLLEELLSSLRSAQNNRKVVNNRPLPAPSFLKSIPSPTGSSSIAPSRAVGYRERTTITARFPIHQTATAQVKRTPSLKPVNTPFKEKTAKPESYKDKLLAQLNRDVKKNVPKQKTVKKSPRLQARREKGTFIYSDCSCSDHRCSCCGSRADSMAESPVRIQSVQQNPESKASDSGEFHRGTLRPSKIYHY